MRAGERPQARQVVVPPGSAVIDSMVDVHPESGALYRSVLIHGPVGIGTVELMVPVELAPLLSAAFAGRPAPMPEPTVPAVVEAWIRATVHETALLIEAELAEAPLDNVVCHVCKDRHWPHYQGAGGGRWVCSGRPGCDSGALWPAGGLSAAQLDGTACVRCGVLLPAVSTPAGRVLGHGQVFACAPSCPGGAK